MRLVPIISSRSQLQAQRVDVRRGWARPPSGPRDWCPSSSARRSCNRARCGHGEETGPWGPRGQRATGPKGPKAPKGPKRLKGPKGPKGPRGGSSGGLAAELTLTVVPILATSGSQVSSAGGLAASCLQAWMCGVEGLVWRGEGWKGCGWEGGGVAGGRLRVHPRRPWARRRVRGRGIAWRGGRGGGVLVQPPPAVGCESAPHPFFSHHVSWTTITP
eukprot:92200-Chlamydomonas_euryale.AAC.1